MTRRIVAELYAPCSSVRQRQEINKENVSLRTGCVFLDYEPKQPAVRAEKILSKKKILWESSENS